MGQVRSEERLQQKTEVIRMNRDKTEQLLCKSYTVGKLFLEGIMIWFLYKGADTKFVFAAGILYLSLVIEDGVFKILTMMSN